MREGFDVIPFVIGGVIGVVLSLMTVYFIKRKGEREKRYDERYIVMQYQSRSLAWGVTALTLVVVFAVLYIVEGFSLATFLVLATYIIHLAVQWLYYQKLKSRG